MTAFGATGADFTTGTAGSLWSGAQQLVLFLGLGGASQQFFGAGAATSGLPQQHPVSALSTGAHAHAADAHPAPVFALPASALTGSANTGSANTGVS